jgi:hypothetical protein
VILMHDIFARDPDPLDGLLAPQPLPPETDALRQTIYSQTERALRRRRGVRRFAYAAALLISFAAGLLAMRAAMRDVPAPIPEERVRRQQESSPTIQPQVPADEPALAREWRAFDSVEHRGELYQQAGDSYMTEEIDPQSALRCYTNALDSGTEKDLTISADDNWLLMAIKNARQKENDHAKSGG